MQEQLQSEIEGKHLSIMKTKIVTDSGSGLTKKQADELGIGFLPLQVLADDDHYLDGMDLETKDLYSMLAAGKMPTTSQPPLYMVEELFEDYKKDGITDIVLVNLSSGLSGTNENLQAAAQRIGLNAHTTDIYTTLGVEKYLALAANQLLNQGKTPDEIVAALKEAVDGSAGYLIVEDLDHLAAGGRLTPMAAKLGGMLKIKPIMLVSKDTEGKVDVYGKVRTFSKALKTALAQMAEDIKPDQEYEFFLMSTDPEERDKALAEMKAVLGDDINVHLEDMYAVIASHTGLGSIGYQYIPKIEGVEIE